MKRIITSALCAAALLAVPVTASAATPAGGDTVVNKCKKSKDCRFVEIDPSHFDAMRKDPAGTMFRSHPRPTFMRLLNLKPKTFRRAMYESAKMPVFK